MLKLRIFGILLVVFLLATLFVLAPQTIAQSGGERDLTVEELGFTDVVMYGPRSVAHYYFELPMSWEMVEGNYLLLDIEHKASGSPAVFEQLSASIVVRFNTHIVHTQVLSTPTAQQLRINLPADQFRLSSKDTKANDIEILFSTDAECDVKVFSSLLLKPTSRLHFVYQERPWTPDLARFPYPFYQRYGFDEPKHVRFVLPEKFDETDVRAASIVAARLGQLTSNRLPISVTLASAQLDTAAISGENLIVIGKPDKNSLIKEMELPMPLAKGRFVQGSQAVAEDAGVLQEVISPWNPGRVALVVTGLTDEALLKAAQGLNPDNHFPGIWGQTAVITEIQPITHTAVAAPQDITFASLGYENKELIVIDLEAGEYVFDFPPGNTLGEDSYLSLHFAHAPSVSTIGGSIKVTLNGVAIGSVTLDDSNVNNTWTKIPLGQTAIRPGLNRLRIESMVNVADRCVVKKNYWLAIYNDSFLHLTYKPAHTRFSLDKFPYPFNQPGDLTNVVFSLAETPPMTDIEGLFRVASLLGSSTRSKDFLPSVVLGGKPQSTSFASSHILAVGLPAMNPLIQEVNDQLPQPFLPNSNEIYQRIDKPTYVIPPDADLGYIQALVSPWAGSKTLEMVVATGTTDAGVGWATSALAQPFNNELSGNLALVRDGGVFSIDTRPVLVTKEAPPSTESITSTSLTPPTLTEGLPVAAVETPTSLQNVDQPAELAEKPAAPSRPDPATGVVVSPAAAVRSQPVWLLPLVVVSVIATGALVFIWFRKVR